MAPRRRAFCCGLARVDDEQAGRALCEIGGRGPPFVFLLLFFALPALIMVLASFRYPGEFGGLASLFPLTGSDETGLTAGEHRTFEKMIRTDGLPGWSKYRLNVRQCRLQ